MSLPSVYVQVYGQIPDFFAKIQEGQAPSKFTQQHLKDIGFLSSSYRPMIQVMKAIGFLTADGSPTSLYHNFRSKEEAPLVMAQALREAYSDLFIIKDPPTEKDRLLIEGKFKSVHNATERTADLMTRTFFGLAKLANFSGGPIVKQPILAEPSPEETLDSAIKKPHHNISPSLHYNIQIHLPATKDVEVYNAIFKSLKEHLID